MKMKHLIIAMISISLLAACEKEGGDGNATLISRNNDDESHKQGQDCMNCHVQGGSGDGWFQLAGSVYDHTLTNAYPNGSVKLTTESNGSGTTVKTIETDSKGNFYTTETIDFGIGLYVGVYGTNGEQKFMLSKITSGACNSCHGITADMIWLE